MRPVESVGAEDLHRVFCARRDQRANAGAHSCAVWVRRPSPCIQRNQHPSQPTLLLLRVCEHARAYASSYDADGELSQVAWPYGIYAFRTRRCGRGFGFGVYDRLQHTDGKIGGRGHSQPLQAAVLARRVCSVHDRFGSGPASVPIDQLALAATAPISTKSCSQRTHTPSTPSNLRSIKCADCGCFVLIGAIACVALSGCFTRPPSDERERRSAPPLEPSRATALASEKASVASTAGTRAFKAPPTAGMGSHKVNQIRHPTLQKFEAKNAPPLYGVMARVDPAFI